MKLTENFSKSEFESKDGSKMPDDVFENIKFLANELQVLRDVLKQPIKINSAYRSPSHNRKVGGVKKSQHVKGNAVDIVVKGLSTEQLAYKIDELISKGIMQQGGIGIYDTFVHYDIRGSKARWDFRTN